MTGRYWDILDFQAAPATPINTLPTDLQISGVSVRLTIHAIRSERYSGSVVKSQNMFGNKE
jgi:hypothetical protein